MPQADSIQPDSELALGQIDAPQKFAIHTKAPALRPGCMSKQSMLDGMEKSLKDLGVETVHVSGPTLAGNSLM